ncbi:MAG: EAL domain-containing protein [Sulfurimicrobium sp.]|nr:EAL domain-containing protein [Sulfurimicrobium sp.]
MINVETIHAGLDNGELFIEYLPIIELQHERCAGAEALVRWQRPTGALHPGPKPWRHC